MLTVMTKKEEKKGKDASCFARARLFSYLC